MTTFNVPAKIRERAIRRKFVNLGPIWRPLEAIAVYPPLPARDLVHCVNKIPLFSMKPWVVSFESRLPRTLEGEEWLKSVLRNRLRSKDCRGIIGMSQWARRMFERSHSDWVHLPEVMGKFHVIHPTLDLKHPAPRKLGPKDDIELVFVGNSFARKGGIVALRLARKALDAGIGVRIHLVSAMEYSGGQHTDHPDRTRYDEDMKALELPNVTLHGRLANAAVLALMQRCHFQLLATVHDTYGFSVIEGFSTGLPAITSDICALPEIVTYGKDGYTLALPKDALNIWANVRADKDPDYWSILTDTYESLADQALERIVYVHRNREQVEKLSLGAIDTAEARHDPAKAAAALEKIYNS